LTVGRKQSYVGVRLICDFHPDRFPNDIRADLDELRRVAVRHLIRAYNTDDSAIADKIMAEAAIMLTVVSKVEELIKK
jgi:hypothetical protein